MANYWAKKPAAELASGKNVLRWYSEAEVLQVARPDWVNSAGETCPGRAVGLSIEAIKADPTVAARAAAIFREVVKKIEEMES